MTELGYDLFRSDLAEFRTEVRNSLGELTAELRQLNSRTGKSEARIEVLQSHVSDIRTDARDAKAEANLNGLFAKYIGPLVAIVSGLLSGQWR